MPTWGGEICPVVRGTAVQHQPAPGPAADTGSPRPANRSGACCVYHSDGTERARASWMESRPPAHTTARIAGAGGLPPGPVRKPTCLTVPVGGRSSELGRGTRGGRGSRCMSSGVAVRVDGRFVTSAARPCHVDGPRWSTPVEFVPGRPGSSGRSHPSAGVRPLGPRWARTRTGSTPGLYGAAARSAAASRVGILR